MASLFFFNKQIPRQGFCYKKNLLGYNTSNASHTIIETSKSIITDA